MTESLGQPKAPTPPPPQAQSVPPIPSCFSEPHRGSLFLQPQVQEILVFGTDLRLFLLPLVAGLLGSYLTDPDTKGQREVKVC